MACFEERVEGGVLCGRDLGRRHVPPLRACRLSARVEAVSRQLLGAASSEEEPPVGSSWRAVWRLAFKLVDQCGERALAIVVDGVRKLLLPTKVLDAVADVGEQAARHRSLGSPPAARIICATSSDGASMVPIPRT